MVVRECSSLKDGEPIIAAFVDDVLRGRGGCLVVEGRDLPEVPVPAGVEVIRLRAVADERLLAYAGLAELVTPLLPLVDGLPPVQAMALEGALALGPPSGDALAVATALRSVLHLAAERGPLVIVIEHAHLLDPGTAAALAHATRRLGEAAVGIIITQDPGSPDRLELPESSRIVLSATAPTSPATTARIDLTRALERAEARGSTADVAAALDAIAAEVTGAERTEVLLRAGQAWLDAGHTDRATAVGCAVLSACAEPGVSARAELLLGRAAAALGQGRASAEHLEAAVEVGRACDPRVAAEALLLLASPALFAGRLVAAEDALREAGDLLDVAGAPDADPLRRLHAAAEIALALAAGRPTDVGSFSLIVEEVAGDPALTGDLSLIVTTVALPLIWLERYPAAASFLQEVVGTLRARGANGALALPLCALAVAERRAGRPTRSLIHAAEARELAIQTGNRTALLFAQSELANAHSLFGDVERCRSTAGAVLASGTRGPFRTSALSALATVELWSGDPAAAIDLLEPLVGAGDGLAQSVTLFHHTLLTAYVAVGRTDDAVRLLGDLAAAAPCADGRLRSVIARCEALLAPAEERDARFADAVESAGDQLVNRGLTRLLHARRLLADGCTAQAAIVLGELSGETDENLLGVARSARLTLTRLGLVAAGADPAWSHLGPAELEVALAAADQTSVLTLADRLRLSPPEVERLRDRVLDVVGARAGPEVRDAMRRPMDEDRHGGGPPQFEVRVLGGLAVLVDGTPVALPFGAASTAVALLALRRAVHVEELTDGLWPEAAPELARRRLRNVLARVKQAAGPILVRQGDRVELAAEVVVDHHVLEARARRALATAPGPARRAALEALIDEADRPLLPEVLYEEWAEPARRRAEARREELRIALASERG